ncbi:DUF7426 family protein [Rhodococcus sp. SJ-2]
MEDLATFMDPDLHLPIQGRDYPIHCTAWQGLHLHQLIATGAQLNDEQERTEVLQMLGPTYQHMVDDGIGWPTIAHAARVAMLWFGHSEAAGQAMWESAGVPGNPIPPSPKQERMGEKLRSIFQRPERTDRMILAAARTTP